VLARLNPTFTAADHTTLQDQLDLLRAEAARLQAEAAGTRYAPDGTNPHGALQASILARQTNEYRSSLDGYDGRIADLQTQIAGANAQAAYFRERLGIASDLEAMHQKLFARGFGSRSYALAAADSRVSLEASLSLAQSEAEQAGQKLAAEKAGRQAFVAHWNGEISQTLAETRGKLVEAEQLNAKANLHNQLVLMTATRDAVVLSVAKVSVGSVVTSAEPLIQLVPIDTPLSVEADIAGIESGYVSRGDEVRIKFDTLPFLRYGAARGVVRTISPDSFSPESMAKNGGATLPGGPNTLYYRARISLDKLNLHNTPGGFRPVPGMPITADVKVGTRSVLSYFIDRILPVAVDGLREP
jgi:hemolysin D